MKHEFKPFDRVLVRDADCDVWRIQFYSHPYGELHACLNSVHVQCIPYEGNENLLGTKDEPEPEFKKGDIVLVWDQYCNAAKGIRVYSHYDSELCRHMVYAQLLKDGITAQFEHYNHAEKFVPATVEGQEGS